MWACATDDRSTGTMIWAGKGCNLPNFGTLKKITIPIFVHKMSQQMTDQRAMIWPGKGCNFRTPSNDSTTPSI